MASESKVCIPCENFRLSLIEKENEIKKLKIHIQNLTNYILLKETITDQSSNADVKTNHDLNQINETEVNRAKFISSEIFIASCDILNRCTILESKSTQTEIAGNSDDFNESTVGTNEMSQSKDGNLHDYIYDKNYNMYYSLSTGYYYDEKSGLMYEPQSCTYYRYNYDKKEYEKVSEGEFPNIEEAHSDVCKDGKEAGYNCETVVDQVNNLNLNDDLTKTEKPQIENIDKGGSECLTTESEKKSCDINNLQISEDDVSLGCAKDWQPAEGSKLTITDIVKEVVDEHNNMSDYIYDETYQMYYSPSTGYFYDAVRKLLYDPTSGIYYFHDVEKQTYEFYCQTDLNAVDENKSDLKQDSIDKKRLTYRKLYWKKKLEQSKQTAESLDCDISCNEKDSEDIEEFSSPEDGEIFSSDDDSSAPVCIVKSPVKGPCLKTQSTEESYPPSIRAIVENSENLQIGSLILITCVGGIIGRDKINTVCIPDICVSKMHAEIKYNDGYQAYSIVDLGSQNGTFVNEKRLSEPKLKSEPIRLNHGDKLSLGSSKLLLHIHDGYDTCDGCEPGQVLAEISSHIEKKATFISKEEKEKSRREALRRLKKKYGLQSSDFERKATSVTCPGYEDKSEVRRQTVGSDNPYEKTQEASVDVSMPETNKGYQMLKKMGWKEGQTLGTTESGLVEPIPLRPWTSKAGLGSSGDPSCNVENLPRDKKTQKWVKARERYLKLSLGHEAS